MNKKFNVIRITGFKGLLIAVFVIGCIVAGFLTFPGWICMHVWNFVADFIPQMPVMQLLHGVILWCIFALSAYALNQGNFSISIGNSSPVPHNEERIKEIIKQLNEKNAALMPTERTKDVNIESQDIEKDGHDDKMVK